MSVKKLDSGYRLIKLLRLLSEKSLCMNDIVDSLFEDNIDITRETVSRYFSTLREFGTVIEKRNNKFSLKYPLSSVDFDTNELETICLFEKMAFDLYSKKDYKVLKNIFTKLFNLTNFECKEKHENMLKLCLLKEHSNIAQTGKRHKEKIEELSSLMGETKRKLKIKYKDEAYNIVPKYFKYMKENVYLYAFDCDKKENRLFLLDKVEDISILPQLATGGDFGYATTFKIYKRLKRTYDTRQGEIAENFDDYQVITNKDEDKEHLFKRLLRYVDLCEIIYPVSDRIKFQTMVDNMMKTQRGNIMCQKTTKKA